MILNEFKLERYFALHEFTAKYLLSSSDCDGFPLSYVLDTANETEKVLWDQMTLGYTESQGLPLLREAILSYYQLDAIENVLVASPGELNFSAMNVLLDPGDHVISIAPSYQSLYEVIRSVGCEMSFWKPRVEDWQFSLADLETLIRPNTKLLVINFPHNPTGAYLKPGDLQQLIELVRKHNIYLFSDEMYHHLNLEGPLLSPVADLYEKGISLWGTSKSFGLAGLRIGWLVSRDTEFLRKVLAFKDYLSICSSAPGEILALIALSHPEKFIQPNLEKIKSNIALFRKFAEEHTFIEKFIPPKAGSTAFVKINCPGSALDFSNQLVKDTGIMTLPAEMFEYSGPYLRIGFGRSVFPLILERLSDYLV